MRPFSPSARADTRASQAPTRPSGLTRKLIGAVLGILFGIMVLFALVTFRITRASILEELHNSAEQVVSRLEYALAEPMWSYNEQVAESYVEAEMAQEYIIAVVVEDFEKSGPWIVFGRDNTEHEPVEVRNLIALAAELRNSFAEHSGEIIYDGTQIGTVNVYISDGPARQRIRDQVVRIAVITAILGIAMALTTGLLLHRMVVAPIRRLLLRLENVSAGDYTTEAGHHRNDEIGALSGSFEEMVSTIAARETALKSSADEKTAMLREIHHRVKNNFQILSSLMNLQKRAISPEAADALEDSENRIRSMEMVHEKLYESSNLAEIRVDAYIRELAEVLRVHHGISPDRLAVSATEHSIGLDTAIPLGLIVNETVSNAYRHALLTDNDSTLTVEFTVAENKARLTVQDSGPGFPDHTDTNEYEGLGLRLVSALVDQIGGTIELESRTGAIVTVEFPL